MTDARPSETSLSFPGVWTDILPDPTDRDYAPYWEGTRQRELRVVRCQACGRHRWPPRPACASCQSAALQWVAVPGRGRLFTWTVIWQTPYEQYRGLTPYAVAIVEADDVPVRFIGHVEGCRPEALEMGLPLEVDFVPVTEEIVLPTWRVARRV